MYKINKVLLQHCSAQMESRYEDVERNKIIIKTCKDPHQIQELKFRNIILSIEVNMYLSIQEGISKMLA